MICEFCGHEKYEARCWACGKTPGDAPGSVVVNHDHKRPGRIRFTFAPPGEIEAIISVTIRDARALKNALSKLLAE